MNNIYETIIDRHIVYNLIYVYSCRIEWDIKLKVKQKINMTLWEINSCLGIHVRGTLF